MTLFLLILQWKGHQAHTEQAKSRGIYSDNGGQKYSETYSVFLDHVKKLQYDSHSGCVGHFVDILNCASHICTGLMFLKIGGCWQ